jgi:hypothetical protein
LAKLGYQGERLVWRPAAQKADNRHLGLLCPAGQRWDNNGAAEERKKIASLHSVI